MAKQILVLWLDGGLTLERGTDAVLFNPDVRHIWELDGDDPATIWRACSEALALDCRPVDVSRIFRQFSLAAESVWDFAGQERIRLQRTRDGWVGVGTPFVGSRYPLTARGSSPLAVFSSIKRQQLAA